MPARVDDDSRIRAAMFAFLDGLVAAHPDGAVPAAVINLFTYDGKPLRLTVQTGIWKPAFLHAALTIRTTYTAPDHPPPYLDELGEDGLVRYKYRGTDPQHSDNRALRVAMTESRPLAYFFGVGRGRYFASYPVWLRAEDPVRHEFSVAVDEGQLLADLSNLSSLQRAYVERLTRARLHQPMFRARVLVAYDDRCAMCRLHHPELLDAAHIIPDSQPDGLPVVPNGLSLCKIHHAAFDANLIGVRPDLTVDVQPRLLRESDGPMLRHGLQDMAGVQLLVPTRKVSQPDPDRLAVRYEQFRAAG